MSFLLPPGDARVENWTLMSSPLPTLGMITVYLGFVLSAGPRLMSSRSTGLTMRPLLLAYNGLMVLLSAWMAFEFCAVGWLRGGYSLACQPVDRSRRPQAMRMAVVCWVFYLSKLIELLDTVFFVLRKKQDQITFLHVFHHAIMPISWWFGVKYVPGGTSTFHAMLNSVVHTVMYTYYGLAAAGPRFRRYLRWKRLLTIMQIVQFLVVILHTVYNLSIRDCNYPKLFNYWILSYALIFLALFAGFYSKAYPKPGEKGHQLAGQTIVIGPNGSAKIIDDIDTNGVIMTRMRTRSRTAAFEQKKLE